MPLQPNIALETIKALADRRQIESHETDDLIFTAGDPGECLYAIIEGTVTIEWGKGIYELLQAGDCFGFDVMVDPERRRYCSAKAASPLKLLPMNREDFLLAIQELPMFALENLRAIDERLRRLKTKDASNP
jgi:CRP/FNR family cyclic AMP-dependent transcriptional regulator